MFGGLWSHVSSVSGPHGSENMLTWSIGNFPGEIERPTYFQTYRKSCINNGHFLDFDLEKRAVFKNYFPWENVWWPEDACF